jgi:hypothetical protein
MNRRDAEALVQEIMDEYGLIADGWDWEFDQAKKRFGVCRHRLKVIGLSWPLVSLNEREAVETTILHEVAHALAGANAGHGPVWAAWCHDLGIKAERCYDDQSVVMPPAPWYLVCPLCGSRTARQRRTKTPYVCKHDGIRVEWERG